MKSRIKKNDSEEFDELVLEFMNTKDDEILPSLMEAGMKVAKSVRHYYMDLRLDEQFDREMVLEFFYRYLGDRDEVSPTRTIRNIAYAKIQEYIKEAETPHLESYDAYVYSINAVSRLIMQESLEEVLSGLPMRIQSSILYLIYFPEKTSYLKYIHNNSLIDYFIILQGIEKLQDMVNNIQNEEVASFHFKLPETQIARLLLISSLYKVSPAILVLLMQEKNLSSLLQFCSLFGGQSVSIPTVMELRQTIQQASELSTRLEEDKITIGDQEALAYLASDLDKVEEFNDELPLNPVLSAFFEKILQITLKNYDSYQKRLIESVDLENPNDIVKVYDVMNRELRTQIQLLTQISGSIEQREDILKIIDILTKNDSEGDFVPSPFDSE